MRRTLLLTSAVLALGVLSGCSQSSGEGAPTSTAPTEGPSGQTPLNEAPTNEAPPAGDDDAPAVPPGEETPPGDDMPGADDPTGPEDAPTDDAGEDEATTDDRNGEVVFSGDVFTAVRIAAFTRPFAMTFLPDGRALVTEKDGVLNVVTMTGEKRVVRGVPNVAPGGNGGLLDVVLAPDFETGGMVYLSYAEPGEDGKRGLVVARGRLVEDGGGLSLRGTEAIWRALPFVNNTATFGGKLAFSPDGEYLFITSGDRFLDPGQAELLVAEGIGDILPAQDLTNNLGAVIRIRPDGAIPEDNPFVDLPDASGDIWSYGHRNAYGLAFDPDGQLWSHENGPRGGDELQRIVRGENYGWPIVSMGILYDGSVVKPHDFTGGPYRAPDFYFADERPAPSSLLFYEGDLYPDWDGQAFMTTLAGQKLVRFDMDCAEPVSPFTICREGEIAMNERVRDIDVDAEGVIHVLTDGDDARLLRLEPKTAGPAAD